MSVVAKRLDGLRCHLSYSVGLGSGDFVFGGNPAPAEKKAQPAPNFWPMSIVVKARWIKMPLDTEINLGPGDVVLDGVAAPPNRGTVP